MKKIFALSTVGLLVLLALPIGAGAAGQLFKYTGAAPSNGMLVSLANHSDAAPASSATASELIGVVTPDDNQFADTSAGKVHVATDGVANTLVSTLGGDIKAGDRLTVSAVAGIGTKAGGNGWIIGIAQKSFSAQTSGAIQTELTTSTGAKKTTYVGTIPVSVKVTYYTDPSTPVTEKTVAPAWLQHIADTLAKKHVSTTALILSFILFVVGLVAAIVIVSSAIRGSFMSIARQPLAKTEIVRIELRSMGVAGGVLLAALVMAFVLLRVL